MDTITLPARPTLQALLRDLEAALARDDHAAAAALNALVEQRLFEAWTELEALERQAGALRKALEAAALADETAADAGADELSLDGELSAPAEQGVEYPVWFATTRQPIGDGWEGDGKGDKTGFTGIRGPGTTYGTVEVLIPAAIRYGKSGLGWLQRLVQLDLSDDPIRVTDTRLRAKPDFFADLRARLQPDAETGAAPEVVVFIHGFRTTFEQAAIRTAQVGRDLSLPPDRVGFFSWPSHGSTLAYLSDEAAIEGSEGALADFLVDLARSSGASKVNLVAHSMGNRGLLRALQRISARADPAVRFGQIILAAPDLDRDLFLDLAHLYPQHSERTTLYTSRRDVAVFASSRLHSAPRVGLFDPVTRAAGIDTVCVPDFNVDLLGHSYFAQAEALLTDMGTLLRTNQAPPRQRVDEVTGESPTYWTFRR